MFRSFLPVTVRRDGRLFKFSMAPSFNSVIKIRFKFPWLISVIRFNRGVKLLGQQMILPLLELLFKLLLKFRVRKALWR